MTHLDLAAALKDEPVKVGKSILSKIEHGTRRVTDIEVMALASALGVPVSWLMCEDEYWESVGGTTPPWPGKPGA